VSEERRAHQRINLPKAIDGWFGDFFIRLLDISASGARVEHEDPIPEDSRALLRFSWKGEDVEILAERVRGYANSSGVRFLEESETIFRLVAQAATDILLAQEANALGNREANILDGDETLTAASAGARLAIKKFVVWQFDGSNWTQEVSLLPDQPPNGFTVSAGEPEEEVEMLCRSYESGNEEARRMIRALAEISVARGR
jgi:hypothetical protein